MERPLNAFVKKAFLFIEIRRTAINAGAYLRELACVQFETHE